MFIPPLFIKFPKEVTPNWCSAYIRFHNRVSKSGMLAFLYSPLLMNSPALSMYGSLLPENVDDFTWTLTEDAIIPPSPLLEGLSSISLMMCQSIPLEDDAFIQFMLHTYLQLALQQVLFQMEAVSEEDESEESYH